MGRLRGYWRSPRGQTIVEFALLTPIVLVLLAAIIDFGAAMNRRIVLQHAAREGARMAAVSDNYTGEDGVCDYTFKQAQGAIDSEQDITFSYSDLDDNDQYNAGDNVKITLPAHWDLPILSTALGGLFGDVSINLTATGSARLERAPPDVDSCP